MFSLGGLFRRFLPQPQPESFVRRLERARLSARRFAARHALDPDESAIVLSASVNSAILSPADADWHAASIRELERFRTVCRTRGGTGNQEVDFIEEIDWPKSWLSEGRMYIVLVPDRGAENELRRVYGEGSYLQTCNGSLIADAAMVCNLTFIHVSRRLAPWLWEGSKVDIRESDRPLELKGIGGNFTDTTIVGVDASLAAPTFDCAKAMIERAGATCRSDERVWLAIGLPVDADAPMPTPRPIERYEVIDDPVSLKRSVPRVCLEVLQAERLTYRRPTSPRTVARIMAVERP